MCGSLEILGAKADGGGFMDEILVMGLALRYVAIAAAG